MRARGDSPSSASAGGKEGFVRLHSRTMPVAQATNELQKFVLDWSSAHKLTALETATALIETSKNWLKYVLREERHPNEPEKKADEE